MIYKFKKSKTGNRKLEMTAIEGKKVLRGDFEMDEGAWYMMEYVFHLADVHESLDDVCWRFAYPGWLCWMDKGALVVSDKE